MSSCSAVRLAAYLSASPRRRNVFAVVQKLVQDSCADIGLVLKSGPAAQKVYLPDEELDVVIFSASDRAATSDWFFRLNQALCTASLSDGKHSSLVCMPLMSGCAEMPDDAAVRNVTFMNGSVKRVQCMVGETKVNISAQQVSLLQN